MAKMRITRHEFIRLAGLTAGAAVLGACAPQQTVKEVQIVKPTNTAQPTFPQAGLYMTEQRNISSSLLGRDYQLVVQVPEQYAADPYTSYPVLYVLDGDVFFGIAASLMPILHLTDLLPEMIVVGITYPMRSYDEFWNLRELDYKIPDVKGAPANSHADKFLAALKQEFIPFIEKNYRVKSNQRALYGYSSSGFFVLYALFQEPDLFRYYLSGSGDLESSGPYMLAHDQKLATREKKDRIDLYLSSGSNEYAGSGSSVTSLNELVEAMKAKNYPGVRLTTDTYAGEGHGGGGAAMTFFKGLREFKKQGQL
jgi:uncharacterized protein